MKSVFGALSASVTVPVIVLALMLGFANTAAAEVRTDVIVRSVAFDGRDLSVEYGVGGGCSEHRGEVVLDFNEATYVLNVKVEDVTDKGDNCEAFISGSVSVNLRDMVRDYLKAKGLALNTVSVVLPVVKMTPYSLIPGQ
ncbi:MAG: hypothetical protein U1E10_00650 [Bdellovibrionales bacterium]|nr:hypothetical protein [Bdellovibrionales bacterium]